MSAVFDVEDVEFAYRREPVVSGVSMRISAGAVHAIIGPNGSGKSTLLRLLLGVVRPRAGRVLFRERGVHEWSRRELAREVGVVAQTEEVAFPVRVSELVAMGRYPHLGPWRPIGATDHAAIDRAMERCHVAQLTDRPLSTLSGGERQRVRLARALAQEPRVLVLDEPTASLDIAHEMTLFELLGGLAAEGVTVIVVTHHLNLAARYASRVLLLNEGRVRADGTPADVLTRETIEAVWNWPVTVFPHSGPGRDTGAPQVAPLAAASGLSPTARPACADPITTAAPPRTQGDRDT
jgi:iron complex transport system ATP-binding protein